MNELFTIEPSLSPRLRWVARHGVLTHHTPAFGEAAWMALIPIDKDKGKDILQIFAESCRLYDEAGYLGYGPTEEEALVDLARKTGLRLWGEEVLDA